MIYRLYSSYGNTLGLDEELCFSEIGEDGYWNRHLEIKADGTALRYTVDRAADQHGVLPEGQWSEEEAAKPEYGKVLSLSLELFEAVWAATRCINDPE